MLALSGTLHPVGQPSWDEQQVARARRASARVDRPKAAVLVSEPTGDFAAGMEISPPEISFGLRQGVWAAGTRFKIRGRVLRVDARGFLRDRRNRVVILVKAVGR